MKKFSFEYNDLDQSLEEDGALISVVITAPREMVDFLRRNEYLPFPTHAGWALIDTGADRTAVDSRSMAAIDIPSVGVEPFLTTHGIADLQLFNLSANLPDLGTELISLERAPGGHVSHRPVLGRQIIMLLGRDLLRNLVFTNDGPNAAVTLQA